jgi:ParB-like chromosome segregation protein Spo0J
MMKLYPKPKISIKILDEYRALVPAQSDYEYQSLKQSIKENGFWNSSPIVTNSDGIILDGHHRYRACQELGIDDTVYLEKGTMIDLAFYY